MMLGAQSAAPDLDKGPLEPLETIPVTVCLSDVESSSLLASTRQVKSEMATPQKRKIEDMKCLPVAERLCMGYLSVMYPP